MKILVNIARVIVGLLFIFSGLIKANDPLGLSYKMQEFFDLWGINQFNSWTLIMSVLMNAFEIIAGFALLIGWRIRMFSWLLLLLIIFFTFLTGYAYLSGKFKNCGCFGDCLPIEPKTSFIKDIALLVLITVIFWLQKWIKPIWSNLGSVLSMVLVTACSLGIQWYTLNYLPVFDCLPFKKGNNITEKMKIPVGARPDSFAIVFIYEKGGKKFEFSATELPADLNTYNFVSRKDKMIRKGNAEPAIKGFNLSGESNVDSTTILLSQKYSVILFCENFSVSLSKWEKDFLPVYRAAVAKNIPVYMVTSEPDLAKKQITGKEFANIAIYKCDYTAIRTAARTNPCLYLLNQGTILGKWSRHGLINAQKMLENFDKQPSANPNP
jgi:uncharacterized membrane protein YphA (DoxX/SURF4 family)